MTEWERIQEENARFHAWWESEMAPKLEGMDAFCVGIAENVAMMGWHEALGLDLVRALEDHIRGRNAELDEVEKEMDHAG